MVFGRKLIKRSSLSLSRTQKAMIRDSGMGIGKPGVAHALVVIFLEFFSWGLLTSPTINALNETFPEHTFLMNGLITGIKGILSFLSAPLIGALSDVWGRKSFLLVTVFFTCMPIPMLKISPWWYFALISVSGMFAVTFSVVFAYVADVTDESDRSMAYGAISATFAGSLIISPAVGTYLGGMYGDGVVVALATSIAILDVLFILVAVPESLPDHLRINSWTSSVSWEKADPFSSLRRIGHDYTVVLLCGTVFLSYLPEAGEYSCIFLYLKQVIHFTSEDIAKFIGFVGVLSVVAQTLVLGVLMRYLGNKYVIMVGLALEVVQFIGFGFGRTDWLLWGAGLVAAVSSMTYPAISSLVSTASDPESQGVAQGMITGIRGLCSGLGPALFGCIFYVFDVNLKLNEDIGQTLNGAPPRPGLIPPPSVDPADDRASRPALPTVPGPPFIFGAVFVIVALVLSFLIPEGIHKFRLRPESPSPKVKQLVPPHAETFTYHPVTSNSDCEDVATETVGDVTLSVLTPGSTTSSDNEGHYS